jgi:hypothetical protein
VSAATAKRDRQRGLYGEAYRIAMKWVEMAYRAHHARGDDEKFLDGYHRLWEDIRYYQAWLLIESKELGYSYARFTAAVQATCDHYIEEAWPRRSDIPKPLEWLDVEPHPDTYQQELDSFLRDARDHLSFNPWRRRAMRRRIRAQSERDGGVRISGFPKDRTLVPGTRAHPDD